MRILIHSLAIIWILGLVVWGTFDWYKSYGKLDSNYYIWALVICPLMIFINIIFIFRSSKW